MSPRRHGAIAGNPILVGAITVLVTIVGVFLAYNANNGLPFVPAYHLSAEVPNSAGLIHGNDVRVGGARVGIVAGIKPRLSANGAVSAEVELKLDKTTPPLPVDSTLRIRPRSPLGLKYVELTRGHSTKTLSDGATIALSQSPPGRPVELDDFFGIFDNPTRAGSRTNLDEFGTGLAGRGPALNEALRTLNPLARRLEPVMRNVMDARARFGEFFPALARAAREAAPVAQEQVALYGALDTTFRALAAVATPLQESISGGPPALDAATRELPAQAAFVDQSAELFRRLNPAFKSLSDASVNLAPAFAAGQKSLPRAAALNDRVTHTLVRIQDFAADPRVDPGLRRLARTASLLEPLVAYVTPPQTTCNYYSLFFRNVQSVLSESDTIGSFLRVSILALPQKPGSEAGPSAEPANGPLGDDFSHIPDSFLHSNPYPNTSAPGQTQECEAGNETYTKRQRVLGNEPGSQSTAHELTKRELVK